MIYLSISGGFSAVYFGFHRLFIIVLTGLQGPFLAPGARTARQARAYLIIFSLSLCQKQSITPGCFLRLQAGKYQHSDKVADAMHAVGDKTKKSHVVEGHRPPAGRFLCLPVAFHDRLTWCWPWNDGANSPREIIRLTD